MRSAELAGKQETPTTEQDTTYGSCSSSRPSRHPSPIQPQFPHYCSFQDPDLAPVAADADDDDDEAHQQMKSLLHCRMCSLDGRTSKTGESETSESQGE